MAEKANKKRDELKMMLIKEVTPVCPKLVWPADASIPEAQAINNSVFSVQKQQTCKQPKSKFSPVGSPKNVRELSETQIEDRKE